MESSLNRSAYFTANITSPLGWGKLPIPVPAEGKRNILVFFFFTYDPRAARWQKTKSQAQIVQPVLKKQKVAILILPLWAQQCQLTSVTFCTNSSDFWRLKWIFLILTSHKDSRDFSSPTHHSGQYGTRHDISIFQRTQHPETFCSRPINRLTCSQTAFPSPHPTPTLLPELPGFLLNSVT